MKIISVVGARPNFMKVAPFIREVQRYNQDNREPIQHLWCIRVSIMMIECPKRFFGALNIPEADINLGMGSGTHAEQVGKYHDCF